MAFSAVTGSNMDALFVAAEARGMGLGSMLVRHALSLSANLSTQVNEQNSQAMRFYLKLGFKPVRRDPHDDSGRPYPIVHLVRDDESRAISGSNPPSHGAAASGRQSHASLLGEQPGQPPVELPGGYQLKTR
jgi:hypothetical protein